MQTNNKYVLTGCGLIIVIIFMTILLLLFLFSIFGVERSIHVHPKIDVHSEPPKVDVHLFPKTPVNRLYCYKCTNCEAQFCFNRPLIRLRCPECKKLSLVIDEKE